MHFILGGQLWVEVVKDLEEDEELIAEFQEHNRHYQVPSPKPRQDMGQVTSPSPPKLLPKGDSSAPLTGRFDTAFI